MSELKPEAPADPILLGVVGGAHGIKGEVRIRSFTADPTDIGAYGPLFDAEGNRYTIRSARFQKTVVVAAIAEVRDRNHAERLNGTELFVDRSVLPEDDDEDAFFQTDLIGLSAVSIAGEPIGTVIAIHDFGAGDVVEIRPERGASVMIPFSEAAVPAIDVEAGTMTVEPVAAGLKDSVGDQAEEAAALSEREAGERDER